MKNCRKITTGNIFIILVFLFFPCILSGATTQDRSRYYEQLTGNLLQQLKVMQDENARLAETVREQGKKLTFLEEEYKKLAEENQSLQQNSGAEKEAAKSRHKYLEKKISNLEKKIQKLERLIRDVGQAAAQEGKQKKRSAVRKEEPVDASVECVEHTVEKGHVLFNIAKAYHVSVQEIRKINNLKSDRLFIGQKLLIPVKKERE